MTLALTAPAIVAASFRGSGLPGVDRAQPPVWVVPESETGSVIEPVTLVAAGGHQAAILAPPGVSGTVTSVEVEANGLTFYSVDGFARKLIKGKIPLWRDLSYGMTGQDVDALHTLFSSLMGDAPWAPGASFDLRTVASAQHYMSLLGQPPGPDGDLGTIVPSSWFVWLPGDGFTATEVSVLPGTPAGSPGSVLATARGIPSSVIIRDDLGSSMPLSASDHLVIGGVRLRAADLTPTNRALLDALASAAPIQPSPPGATAAGDGSGFGDTGGSQEVGDLSYAAQLDTSTAGGYAIPATSIMTMRSGNECVVVRGSSGSIHARQVRISPGSRPGRTVVIGALAGSTVLANPSRENAGRLCSN